MLFLFFFKRQLTPSQCAYEIRSNLATNSKWHTLRCPNSRLVTCRFYHDNLPAHRATLKLEYLGQILKLVLGVDFLTMASIFKLGNKHAGD